jgi:hypothetical protein
MPMARLLNAVLLGLVASAYAMWFGVCVLRAPLLWIYRGSSGGRRRR